MNSLRIWEYKDVWLNIMQVVGVVAEQTSQADFTDFGQLI